jgi:hypothetical protein
VACEVSFSGPFGPACLRGTASQAWASALRHRQNAAASVHVAAMYAAAMRFISAEQCLKPVDRPGRGVPSRCPSRGLKQ